VTAEHLLGRGAQNFTFPEQLWKQRKPIIVRTSPCETQTFPRLRHDIVANQVHVVHHFFIVVPKVCVMEDVISKAVIHRVVSEACMFAVSPGLHFFEGGHSESHAPKWKQLVGLRVLQLQEHLLKL